MVQDPQLFFIKASQSNCNKVCAGDTVINRGRVVVVTALECDQRYTELVAAVEDQLAVVNQVMIVMMIMMMMMVNQEAGAAAGPTVAPLAEVEVTVVHTQPSSAGDIGLRTEQVVIMIVMIVMKVMIMIMIRTSPRSAPPSSAQCSAPPSQVESSSFCLLSIYINICLGFSACFRDKYELLVFLTIFS